MLMGIAATFFIVQLQVASSESIVTSTRSMPVQPATFESMQSLAGVQPQSKQ